MRRTRVDFIVELLSTKKLPVSLRERVLQLTSAEIKKNYDLEAEVAEKVERLEKLVDTQAFASAVSTTNESLSFSMEEAQEEEQGSGLLPMDIEALLKSKLGNAFSMSRLMTDEEDESFVEENES